MKTKLILSVCVLIICILSIRPISNAVENVPNNTQISINHFPEENKLWSYWDFDAIEDDILIDKNSYANGTIIGANKVSGILGTGLQFNGSEEITFNQNYISNNSISISLWVKITNTSTTQVMISQRTHQSGHVAFELLTYQGNWYFRYHDAGQTVHQRLNVDPVIQNRWTHLSIVKDSVDNQGKFYLNGSLLVTESWDGGYFGTELYPVLMGQGPSPGDGLYGVLDEVRIYNTSLSHGQIMDIYNQTLIESNLIHETVTETQYETYTISQTEHLTTTVTQNSVETITFFQTEHRTTTVTENSVETSTIFQTTTVEETQKITVTENFVPSGNTSSTNVSIIFFLIGFGIIYLFNYKRSK